MSAHNLQDLHPMIIDLAVCIQLEQSSEGIPFWLESTDNANHNVGHSVQKFQYLHLIREASFQAFILQIVNKSFL